MQFNGFSILAIRPKTQNSNIETLKEMIRAMGMNPEQTLTREPLAEGATTYKNPEDLENRQLTVLSNQLRELLLEAKTG